MSIRHTSRIRQPSSRLALAAIVLSLIASLAGCGHHESAAEKTATLYQGKPDTPPWDNARWQDNRENWQRAIDARAQNQNEYVRIDQ
jgi:ABC-type uncharacterized transport system auxiliary subunit